MRSRVLSGASIQEWYKYYDSLSSGGAYHNPAYLDLLAGNFESPDEQIELFVLEDGDDYVYYPYFRRSLAYASVTSDEYDLSNFSDIVSSWYYGGPLLSSNNCESLVEEFVDSFSDYCDRENIVSEFVRFDPNLCNHEVFDDLSSVCNRQTVYVDLTKSTKTLWDEFEKRNRNAIRQAQEAPIQIMPATETFHYESLYRIYREAMEARGASKHYEFSDRFFDQLRELELSEYMIALYEGEVIGGSIVVYEDGVAHDYLRASDPKYWDMRVNNLLCYETMMEMRDRGVTRFDFQGGRPGVFKFKKAFSPDRGEFHISRRTHNQEVYDHLSARARQQGIDTDSNYFPAYRRDLSN
ncbi:GNAT family N-acetyltransferase [Haloarcula halophila]|uniref:GNAT family N-acetyltransferase n=1 Tax=Haloarcula TaxID=2237 RepID=UPI0023E40A07|nr:GNAT family N-acetyltransferase [Halomicroarcula sp. DFY41]